MKFKEEDKKIIFDFGANEGQNINYFLDRADYVVCVEANQKLCEKIKGEFKESLDSGRLYIENCALSNSDKELETFYIHKEKHTHSQLTKPILIQDFIPTNVKMVKASSLINQHLNYLNLNKAHYIKIDIEHLDHVVFKDILISNINFDYMSCEIHSGIVLNEIIQSKLKYFKVNIGKEIIKQDYINRENKRVNFLKDSSGPFGEDMREKWMNKTSLITYFVNHGFGWFDVCCSNLKEEDIANELMYDRLIHKPLQLGFRFHLKRIIPEFIRASKNIIGVISWRPFKLSRKYLRKFLKIKK